MKFLSFRVLFFVFIEQKIYHANRSCLAQISLNHFGFYLLARIILGTIKHLRLGMAA
jgi:hypothetical protein